MAEVITMPFLTVRNSVIILQTDSVSVASTSIFLVRVYSMLRSVQFWQMDGMGANYNDHIHMNTAGDT